MKKCVLLPLLTACGTLHAQQQPPATKDLNPVVITGQAQPVTISQSLYPVKLLNAATIREKGAVTLSDLLATEMNVRIISDNVLGSNIIMQGITGQNVKILMDGVPMISGEGNEFDLQQLNLNQVERVEVIEGPLSVQYGTNALAGTINLITRKMQPGDKLQGGTTQYIESLGQYNGNLWLGKNVHHWNLMGGAGYTWFKGYSSPEYKEGINTPDGNVRGQNWNAKNQLTGNLKIYRQFKNINTGITYNQFYEDALSPGNADPGTAYLTASDYKYLTNRSTVLLFANGSPKPNTYLDIINSYSYYDRNSEQYIVNLQNKSSQQTSDARTAFRSWSFRGAYSQSNIGHALLNYQLGYDVNLNSSTGDRVSADAGRIDDIGIFSRIGLTVWKQLEIQGGLRYTYNNRYDASAINFLGQKLPFISSLQLRWNITSHWYARGSYARGFRAPSQRELYWDFKNANHYIIGNPDLMPELAHNFMSGLYYQQHNGAGGWTAQLSAFLNNISNKIELVELDRSTLPPAYQSINVARTYSNIPEFKTRGINIGAGYTKAGLWHLKPSLGYLTRSGSNSMNAQFGSWEAGLNAMYNMLPVKTKINLFYKYNGPMAQFGITDGKLTDRTLGGYSLLDLSASKDFLEHKLMITLGAKNLFNVTDVAQTGDGKDGLMLRSGFKTALPVAWGRTVFLRSTYNF